MSRRRGTRRVLVSLLATAMVLASAAVTSTAMSEPFGVEKQRYDSWIKRPSLHKRTVARERFAQTGDVRALKILASSYPKAEKPTDHVQYLLTSICATWFYDKDHVAAWDEWRTGQKATKDAWLWYRSLIVHLDHQGTDELFAAARNEELDLFLRAAALEALADNGRQKDVLPLITEVFDAIPKGNKMPARFVLWESLTSVLLSQKWKLGDEAFKAPAERLILLLDEKKEVPDRTKLIIARYMQEIFDADRPYINSEMWLKLLAGGVPAGTTRRDGRYASDDPPEFVGIRANGTRICYVIDMSDSMLTPLSQEEKKELKKKRAKGPVTGKDAEGEDDEGNPKEKKKDDDKDDKEDKPSADDLPWDRINNRFDAAREFLKLSLRTLTPDKHFSVIFFGNDAKLLKSCGGMIPASKGNVDRVIRELDKVKKGPKQADRPHGTLRGFTNMHGALRRAFKVKGRGLSGDFEYVTPVTFTEGCDTIFLLSDGAPTWDDWPALDKKDPEDNVGDPETGTPHAELPDLEFWGPYRWERFLVDDVRRLNLFRKCEIHCVGMGEAQMSLLSRIAALGKGEAIWVGGTE